MIISPVPTHPTNAGNRRGVLNLSNYFINRGDDVTFCYLELELFSFEQIAHHFNHKMIVFNKDEIQSSKQSLLDKILNKRRTVNKIIQWCTWKCNIIDSDEYKYNSDIDDLISNQFLRYFKNKVSGKWDIVVAEYVWTSKLLTLFPRKTLKIIDTHDNFSNRFKIYREMGIEPTWYSFYPKNEFRGLKRSNIILALNDEDKMLYKKKCKRKVVKYFYTPELNILPIKDFSYTLLYFASSNVNNITAINHFVSYIFPEIKMIIPNVKLLIGGEICTRIRLINPDVYLMGMCEDPKDFYKLGDISINPEMSGTGFKIKIIESLHFGKPVISSEIGIRGLRDRSIQKCPLLIAENAQDYIQCIRFLSDQENYLDNQNKCTEYIYKITDQATSDLTNALDTYFLDK